MEMIPGFIKTIGKQGILEFDYVPSSRPPMDAKPVTERRLKEILVSLGLIADEKTDKVYQRNTQDISSIALNPQTFNTKGT